MSAPLLSRLARFAMSWWLLPICAWLGVLGFAQGACELRSCRMHFPPSANSAVPQQFSVFAKDKASGAMVDVPLTGLDRREPGFCLRFDCYLPQGGASRYGSWNVDSVVRNGTSIIVTAHQPDEAIAREVYAYDGSRFVPIEAKVMDNSYGFIGIAGGAVVFLMFVLIRQRLASGGRVPA